VGPVRQPRHPHSLALARVLLEAGADPNDAQTLYNRMFEPDNDHLELLLEFGLGTGDGGPWRARLGDATDSPRRLIRGQLRQAITHGMLARVQLLVAHGVDIVSPFGDGVTPVTRALTTGNEDVAAYLIAQGSPPAALDAAGEFIAAALAADRDRVDAALAAEIRAAQPGLIVWAAGHGKPGSVELLATLGFDVNAMGRSDAPADDRWQTALHVAAMEGNADLARSLLALGAATGIRDARFDSTPLGWARYFGQQDLIDLLVPITEP
jgi:ankyrin repeat protein